MTVELIQPEQVFALLEQELPSEVFDSVFVAGSLAAAYHHREALTDRGVKTKDADLVLHPASNTAAAASIARKLIDAGWTARSLSGRHPGTASTPADRLPAIRLHPPGHERYFVELLIVPDGAVRGKAWKAVNVGGDYYGLPMFEFMALLSRGRRSSAKLEYADPCMMALANALSHEVLDQDPPMSTPVENRDIHRSSKDLGRVLALAWLTELDELDAWAGAWEAALRETFPSRWHGLARRVGSGLRALVANDERFDEAHHTCNVGLLGGKGVTLAQLHATARQFIALVVQPVEAAGAQAS